MFTKEYLKDQLKDMGIRSNDTVLIHTSLRAIGPVEGGADGLIDTFCEYLEDGLFLIPTHTWANVDRQSPVYDVNTTVPCIGTLPRIAAFRKDGIRSLHPTHSIWAHGRDAVSFVQNEENASTPAPPGFAWERLAKVNAKILLIGVGNNRNTFIHAVDELAQLPDRINPIPFEAVIYDHQGNVHHRLFSHHHCSKTNDVSAQYPNFEKALIVSGAQTFGKLGNATVRIVDAAKCRDIILHIYSQADRDLCIEPMEIPEEYYQL